MLTKFDAKTIREALANLIEPGNVFEVRLIGNDKRVKPISGYFKDADRLLEAFNTVDLRKANVYITLQQVNNNCFARIQSNKFVMGAQATSDNDIIGYRWLFIDLDPERTSGVSASDEELNEAKALANDVYKYMRSLGFYEPMRAYSGNGCHLLYKVQLEPSEANEELLQRCLETLATLFDNGKVKIDTVNYNPARVCKLYGTVAKKGANTEDRPYRMSQLLPAEAEIQVNPKVFLEKLAAQMPEAETVQPANYNNYSPSEFDVEAFMNAHSVKFKVQSYKGGTKYVLDECPFNSEHQAPDSAIFKTSEGKLGFKCLHNSCSDKCWKDVRIKYEPDAYERKKDEIDQRIDEGIRLFNRQREDVKYTEETIETPAAPMFLTMEMVNDMPDQYNEYIKTGIKVVDDKLCGLAKKAISVVTGSRGSAKSTLLSNVMLNAINQGCNVVCYSGELSPQNFWRWLSVQAAGKNHVIGTGKNKEVWQVESEEIKFSIAKWISSKLWLYNNEYGNSFAKIATRLRAVIEEKKADLVVIDNLMALDLSEVDQDKYEAQTKFVLQLKNIAKLCNVHIIFVAHPRKAQGFLRLDDISGSGNIANIVDVAFVVHRVNEDFKRLSQQMFKWSADNPLYNATNCVEICKDRETGVQDVFIPLWYEGRTKRMLNNKDEYMEYNWKPAEETEDTLF